MPSYFNDGGSARLYNYSSILPDYVKDAPAESEQDFSKLASEWFADASNRRYPVDSKANTFLSIMNFVLDKEAMEPWRAKAVGDRLMKEASAWGVESPVVPSEPEAVSHKIQLKVAGDVAHVVDIHGKRSWKEAAEDMYSNPSKLPYGARRQLARGLLTAPVDMRAEVSEDVGRYLEKAAGFGMATKDDAASAVMDRVVMLDRENPEMTKPLRDWAGGLPDGMTPEILSKTASLLDIFDRATGTNRWYRRGVETPEEMIFKYLEKDAEEMDAEAVTLMDGRVVSRTGLVNREKEIKEFMERYLGEAPWSSPDEMVEFIETLPRPDAQALGNSVDLGPELGA